MGFYVPAPSGIGIFFGSHKEYIIPASYKNMLSSEVIDKEPFRDIAQTMGLKKIVFLHQTHGAQGALVGDCDIPVFQQEGDFLLTRTPGVGIAVATADCIPLVVYSVRHNVVGVIHAGWRGTVAEIVPACLDLFMLQIDNDKESIRVIVGPSARVCCYQVQHDFVQQLQPAFAACVQERNGLYFFDGVAYNKQLLLAYGVSSDAVQDTSVCTMHNEGYCSYRSSRGSLERQYAVVALK